MATSAETLSVTDMLPNKFEPKRKHRWIFAIEGIDAFLIKTAARPNFTMGQIKIPWMNTQRYISKRLEFNSLSVNLHDPIAPSGAQQVMEWIRTHHESVSGRSGYADFYKRDCQLKMLDPIGTVIELWDIKGAHLINVGFGSLDYGSDDIMMIELTMKVDNCVLQF